MASRASVSWQNQPPGKAAGDQVAQELLDAAVLPLGSQRLTKSPTPLLNTPFTTVADDNFLDHNSWWKVNLSTGDLLAYLRAHQVKGLVSTGTGGGVSGPNQPTEYSLEFDPAHALAGNPDLQFSVVAAGANASWLRVDGQTIWYPARPADETAPTTGTVLISISSGPTRAVIDPATVSRLAAEFNGLLRTTPGKSSGVSCSPNERTLSISFFGGPGETSPVISASLSGCSSAWAIRGPSGDDLPALENGGHLLADAMRLLGVSPNGLYVPVPTPIPSAGG